MSPYNKSAMNAYSQASVAGIDGKTLSIKILKSILFYIDQSISLYDKNNGNTVQCYQLLSDANRLLIDLVENMSLDEGEERDSVLTILQRVEFDIMNAIKEDYTHLKTSKRGLETIVEIIES